MTNNYMIDNILYSFQNNYDVVSIEIYKTAGILAFYNDDSINYKLLISDEEFKNGLTYDYSKMNDEYCANLNLKLISGKNECNNSILNNSYNCKKGICFKTKSSMEPGLYLVDNVLYYCKSGSDDIGIDSVTCKKDSVGTYDGILFFKDDSNKSNISYMKNIDNSELKDITDYLENEIYLYNCHSGDCKNALKNGINVLNSYKKNNMDYINIENLNEDISYKNSIKIIYYNEENEIVTEFQTKNSSDCSKTVGELIQVQGSGPIYLCLSEDQSVKFGSEGNNYLLDIFSIDKNVFTKYKSSSTTHIAIKSTKNGFFLDNEIIKILS
eukprot:jgi/Orpsp1_1/1188844/evm.model.d7180000067671.1